MGILANILRSLKSGRGESVAQQALSEMRLGWEAYRAGRYPDAVKSADAALAGSQGNPELRGDASQLRAFARMANGDFRGALQDFDHALQIMPESVDCLLGQGKALHELNRFEDALAVAEKMIALDPCNAVAHNNRGLMLRELALHNEAEVSIRRALELKDGFHDARANLALLLIEMGRLHQAKEELDGVLSDNPLHVDARWNRAILNLLLGNFSEGWRDYSARLESDSARMRRPFRYPEWRGDRLREGALLIYGEQGLGDDILFASCYQDAISRTDRCIIECEPRLERLFARSFPEARIFASKYEPAPEWTKEGTAIFAQISAGTLPSLFRNRLEDFPPHTGYLRADPVAIEHWRARLSSLGEGLKIGISWAGGTARTRRATRSIPLDDWHPVFEVPACHFISLQYGNCGAEIADFRARSGILLHHWPEAIDDYDNTAALVGALDLVISVTTSIVHLSGALGQKVWVLVPANPEWRYLHRGDSMPWYPSARLFRQSAMGDWTGVLNEVATALRYRVSSSARPVSRP